MAKKWAEILADSKAYGDDFVVTTKDGDTFTLGEARARDRETEGALTAKLTAKETALANDRRELEKASMGIKSMFEQYLEMTGLSAEEALAGKKPVGRKETAAATGLDENDPILAPMIKEVNALKSQVDSLKAEQTNQRDKIFKPVVQQYLNDFYEMQYETRIAPSIPEKAKGKVTLETLMKTAEENGYKDKSGRLNLRKAADDLTQEYRIEDQVESRVQARLKEERDKSTMAAIGKPQSGPRAGTPKSFVNAKGKTKSFDEVLQDAANDQELWSGLAGNA